MRAIAPQILNKNIRRVGLGREAIVSNVDLRVGHRQPLNVVRIKAVCVFGERLQI